MKKILLATTMLATSAGFAAAEVAITGYAEMGIWSDSNGNVQFWQDVEVTFAMSGTTDGGLEFGAAIDLDETDVASRSGQDVTTVLTGFNDDSGTTVYISGGFGKLTMGDTDGALDWAVQDSGSLTSITDDHTTHVGYFSANGYDGGTATYGDGQIARYENTFGSVSFAISAEQGDEGIGAATAEDIWGIGVKYTADLGGTALNLGLGYQDAGVDSVVGVSVGAELAGGFSGVIGYETGDVLGGGVAEYDHLGVGLTYTTGALSMHINYGDYDETGVASDVDSYGVAVNYDLGGGAVVMAGYGSDVSGAAGSQDQWSVGLGMSF